MQLTASETSASFSRLQGPDPRSGASIPAFLRTVRRRLPREWQLHLILLLPFLYYVLFHYVPMYGVVIAFKDYSFGRGILGSPWIGLRNFVDFFGSAFIGRLIRNTFLLGLYSLIFSFPVPILFALALNEIRSTVLRRAAQTVSYLPYFISVVVVIGMMYNFLSLDTGLVNTVLASLGRQKVNFLTSSRWFRSLYVASGIWQTFGFTSIIYLAAMTAIDPELYEAVEVDGGHRAHKILYITLPSLLPTITILLLLSIGAIFSVGFEKVLLMYSPGVYEVADVVQTYVYRRGIVQSDFSFASAAGLFNSVVNFVFLVVFNYLSRALRGTSIW